MTPLLGTLPLPLPQPGAMQGMSQFLCCVKSPTVAGQGAPLPLAGARTLWDLDMDPGPQGFPWEGVQALQSVQLESEHGMSGEGWQDTMAQGAGSVTSCLQVPVPVAGLRMDRCRTLTPPPHVELQGPHSPQGPYSQSALGMLGSYTR